MIDLHRANVLIEALPYIEKYHGKTIVVKYGGSAMKQDSLKDLVMEDLVLMSYVGINIVLVHGGGNEINKMLNKVGIDSKFVNGYRYTDEDTMEIVQMVLAGKINKELVYRLNSKGGKSIGICGIDDNLLLCETNPENDKLGYVGNIKKVNTSIINNCLDSGYISVVATVGIDEDGQTYNINADTAACAIASELKAEKVILLTDVAGILENAENEDTLVSEADIEKVKILINKGVISGGMIPKVQSCIDALNNGVKRVHILDGRIPHSIITELFTDSGIGTLIY
ncbi:MAG: acetylglutamate kinase [Peptostreptococcaceae bacterium]